MRALVTTLVLCVGLLGADRAGASDLASAEVDVTPSTIDVDLGDRATIDVTVTNHGDVDVTDVVAHIERVVESAGIDAVGIGYDYDGVGDSLPDGLKDASTYPRLVEALLARDFSRSDIRKLLGGNTLRVWRANEDYARANGGTVQCAS